MMHSVTVRFEFSAAHRILGHLGKCKYLHGHNYVAEITIRQKIGRLDPIDMVVDFADVKRSIGRWIDNNWDHNFICNDHDVLLTTAGATSAFLEEMWKGRKPFVMPNNENPTAERMAELLHAVAKINLSQWQNVEVANVRIYETPDCWADYSSEAS